MTDPEVVEEVVEDDVDIEDEEEEGERRKKRRWWSLLILLLLALLLLCCAVTSAKLWVDGGSQEARFIARNLECLQCHTEVIPDFSKAAVHNPFALKTCTACHTPHGKKVTVNVTGGLGQIWKRFTTSIQWLPLRLWLGATEGTAGRTGETVEVTGEGGALKNRTVEVKGAESMLIMPETELCWYCHGSMGAKLSEMTVHQPFGAGRCTNCHDPHSSDWSGILTQAPNKLCLTCHPTAEERGMDQIHPSFEQGWCIDCHDPHASEYVGMTVVGQLELCFRCHPSVATMQDLPVQHAPFINGMCTDCHEPHASDDRPLLVRADPRLCYSCHPAIANQFARPSHHPVGITLVCSSCHNPHAAQASSLVSASDNSFCYGCHNDVMVEYDSSGHTGVLCMKCHTPHGSSTTPMLLDRNPELCFRCHTRRHFDESTTGVTRHNHPVRPVHYDVNAGDPLTCTSSCHDPHGTDYTSMLRYFDSPMDGTCLMCHAVRKGERVAIDF